MADRNIRPERLLAPRDTSPRHAWRNLLQLEVMLLLLLLACLLSLLPIAASYGAATAALHDSGLIIWSAFIVGCILHRFRHIRRDIKDGP